MKPVRLGIIGCGIAARDLHWPALQNLKEMFAVTAVCNHTEPKALEFSRRAGNIPYFLDYRDLLNSKEVEAVDIALPIHLNFPVTRDALAAGKHVILEKPLAANLPEAEKMREFESSFSPVKMVAENFRYKSIFLKAKRLLEEQIIGRVYFTQWNVFLYVTPETNKYAQTQWRLNHQYPGGFITDGGVHNLAALRMLFGEIETNNVFTHSVNPEIGRPDSFSMQFTTSSGVAGSLNLFFSANGFSEDRFVILGEKGSLVLSGNTLALKKFNHTDHQETIEDDGGYTEQFRDFYYAIRDGKKPVSTFSEAYMDLKIILNALKRADSGD